MTANPIINADILERRAVEIGILPYFRCGIPGFSIEEMTPEHVLWDLNDGPWIWKAEIARRGCCAYGKFLRRKAAFISLELLPYFLHYRRYIYNRYRKANEADSDIRLLDAIRSHESLLSRELKELCGYTRPRRRLSPQEQLAAAAEGHVREKAADAGFDAAMARLQMAGLVVIADFEYGRPGHRGWGVARYTTPEAMYGSDIILCKGDPWQSFNRLHSHLAALDWPGATPKTIDRLINF